MPTPAVNADRIASLETLSLSLPKESTVEELDRRLDDIEQRGALYRRWQLVLASAVACMAFAFLDNATWLECASVFLATACALVAAALASGAYVAVVAILRGTVLAPPGIGHGGVGHCLLTLFAINPCPTAPRCNQSDPTAPHIQRQ